jgi:hypothetical protein
MAKFDYTKAQTTAKRLIDKFGDAGTATKKGQEGGFDQFGDSTTATDDVVISGTITPLLSFKASEVDDVFVLSTDSYVFFDSEQLPEIGMITQGLRVVNVVKLTSVEGVRVYCKLQLRK